MRSKLIQYKIYAVYFGYKNKHDKVKISILIEFLRILLIDKFQVWWQSIRKITIKSTFHVQVLLNQCPNS